MQTIAKETNELPEDLVRQVVVQSKTDQVKKLSPMQTYFSLLKGFMSIGILYMPKNTLNGGWLFTLVAMVASFFFTQFALVKLLQAREKGPVGASFAEIARASLGKSGMYVTDVLLCVMQYGFAISFNFFVLDSMKSVIDSIYETDINVYFVGKPLVWTYT